ncbi:hypothetical protein Z948_1571 [Sulfitobacter donghicola DSW-25 = KCTC 12864 = JCM 14565]|nr:hypothetical protein Z948_1571 [Sulfitobacter donghicola DSW-25 = KCTC 12864 = JCM 14565]
MQAVYTNEEGKLVSRALKADQSGFYTFEIKSFEVLEAGVTYN